MIKIPWAQWAASHPFERALITDLSTSPLSSSIVDLAWAYVWLTTSNTGTAAALAVLTDSTETNLTVFSKYCRFGAAPTRLPTMGMSREWLTGNSNTTSANNISENSDSSVLSASYNIASCSHVLRIDFLKLSAFRNNC